MLPNLKRLLLGISLIVLVSTVLLLSDLKQRTLTAGAVPHIGLLQHASVVLLDDTVRGMVDSLAENGFVDGKTIIIQKYNAQGDIAVANLIAKEMVNAHFDLLLTASTLSLQAVANANRGNKTVQVFGAVADPAVAGVGISHDKPLDHPRNLVGIGSFLPVGEAFGIARDMFPGLKRVGVAWNPAEANSRAFTEKARQACQAMNIELLEANVENSNGVLEAEESLVARGAQALWIGGDVTVSIAVDAVISVGQKAGIPVFSITPGKPDRGTVFDYGADFYQIGKQTGELAVRILRGADPGRIPITNLVPTLLVVNTLALKGLKDSWRAPDDLLRRADVVIDGAGIHRKKIGGHSELGRTKRQRTGGYQHRAQERLSFGNLRSTSSLEECWRGTGKACLNYRVTLFFGNLLCCSSVSELCDDEVKQGANPPLASPSNKVRRAELWMQNITTSLTA